MVKRVSKKKEAKEDQQKETEATILPMEIFHELRMNHMEMELAKKDLQNIGLQVENYERAKITATLQRNDIKNKIKRLELAHQEFLERTKSKTGIDLRNITINPETREIIKT